MPRRGAHVPVHASLSTPPTGENAEPQIQGVFLKYFHLENLVWSQCMRMVFLWV